MGTWIAPVRPVGGLTQSATSSIRFDDLKDDPQAPGFNIDLGDRSFGQEARADEVEPGVLRFVSRSSPGGCLDKDVGRYRWSMPSADHLTLELVADQCSARSAIAPGDWIRSGVGESDGGTGIAADFTPFFEFTLPAGTYRGHGNMHDAISLEGSDGSVFKAWKDIDGFVDPCDPAKGRIDLDRRHRRGRDLSLDVRRVDRHGHPGHDHRRASRRPGRAHHQGRTGPRGMR